MQKFAGDSSLDRCSPMHAGAHCSGVCFASYLVKFVRDGASFFRCLRV
jgi:hypothetical protein